VRRTVYWSPQSGTFVPVDRWLGLTEHRVSPGVREMCRREALHCPFEVASGNLQRTAQLSLDGRTLREIVEDQGRAVEAAKRIEQGRSSTASVGRPKPGSEGPFKEFKLQAFYDPDKTHCHVVGTAGDHEVLGRLMRWDQSNAEAMMALASLYHSGLWETYWDSERAAA
jgi:hypothetical protein